MSGIVWGIINFNNEEVSEELGKSMMKLMQHYKIDNYRYIKNENVFLGCGLQYLTTESLNEILPYYDFKNKLIITADAIIDNRENLLSEFNLEDKEVEDFSDSEYILMAYKKWGNECTKYLLGDFSFAIWDENKQELFCSKDHLGRRTFYYCYDNSSFAFCTVCNPLFYVLGEKPNLNERWITDFLALFGGLHISEDEETIYSDIKQLQAAHIMIINRKGLKKQRYWNPLENAKEFKFKTDKEYSDALRNILTEAVKCKLRAKNDIGLMISGGLDSSSVAAIAAPLLKNKEMKLKTFTSVPVKNFAGSNNEHEINDESNDVIALQNFIGNMDINLCRFEGENSINVINNLLNIYEQPYKAIENSYNINNLAKAAGKSNCNVLLEGRYGNVTVSYGNFGTHAKTLFKKKRFIKLYREINDACKMHNIPKRQFTKGVLKTFLPYKIRVKRFLKRNPDYDRFRTSPVNEELIKKYNVNKRFDDKGFNVAVNRSMDLNEARKTIVDPITDSHVFVLNTKISLENGIIIRDPTADIRIIEFCLKVPTEQYVKGGINRRLIRNSMKGLIPESIRMNIESRGVQAADWIERLKPVWKESYKELEEAVNNKNIKKYINVNKLKKLLKETEDGISEEQSTEVLTLLETLIFSKFINKYNQEFNLNF